MSSEAESEHGAPFPVITVDPLSSELTEQMGSKEKFWFEHDVFGRTLFKAARPGSGEDWAEKVAEGVADMLGLPHAKYELAVAASHYGVISPSFVGQEESLIHGNELMSGASSMYSLAVEIEGGRTSQYTLPLVLATIEQSEAVLPPAWLPPSGVRSAADLFVGYLLHDAMVGNTDRHQENWGIIDRSTSTGVRIRYLAPQFDTASCLGRNESDQQRLRRLAGLEGSDVRHYANRARSPFFLDPESHRGLTVFDCFRHASRIRPRAAKAWIDSMGAIALTQITDLLFRIPESRMSEPARRFALEMIIHNQARLLELRGNIS